MSWAGCRHRRRAGTRPARARRRRRCAQLLSPGVPGARALAVACYIQCFIPMFSCSALKSRGIHSGACQVATLDVMRTLVRCGLTHPELRPVATSAAWVGVQAIQAWVDAGEPLNLLSIAGKPCGEGGCRDTGGDWWR